MVLIIRPLTRDDWPAIETLFGAKGACGGCWCMLWRAPFGGRRWKESLGEPNRAAFRSLIESGAIHGILAFRDGRPVGWCSIGPRSEFPGLGRSRVLQSDWDEGTWSVTCFYMPAAERGRGLASRLLRAAIALARKRGARSIEGYPMRPKEAKKIPAAFAWTGVVPLFERAGFRCVVPNEHQPVYRLELQASSSKLQARHRAR
jgi:GNAT superfamily N-acetyltransferase